MEKGFKGASELTNEVTLPEADVMRFRPPGQGRLHRPRGHPGQPGSANKPWLCAYLAIEAEDADCHGAEAVLQNGRRVGAVSSGAYGHLSWKRASPSPILTPDCAAPGTELEVMVLGEAAPGHGALGTGLRPGKPAAPAWKTSGRTHELCA